MLNKWRKKRKRKKQIKSFKKKANEILKNVVEEASEKSPELRNAVYQGILAALTAATADAVGKKLQGGSSKGGASD